MLTQKNNTKVDNHEYIKQIITIQKYVRIYFNSIIILSNKRLA